MPRLEKNSTGVWVLATNSEVTKSSSRVRHAGAALAAAALGAIGRQRHALDVAAVGDGDDHVLALDQVLDVLLELVVEDLGAPRRGELLLDLEQLLAHQREQLVAIAQQLEIALDLLGDLASAPRRSCRAPARSGAAGAARGWRGPAPRTAGRCRSATTSRPGSAISAISGATSTAGQSLAISRSRAIAGIGRAADHRDHLVDVGDGDRRARPGRGRGRAPC